MHNCNTPPQYGVGLDQLFGLADNMGHLRLVQDSQMYNCNISPQYGVGLDQLLGLADNMGHL